MIQQYNVKNALAFTNAIHLSNPVINNSINLAKKLSLRLNEKNGTLGEFKRVPGSIPHAFRDNDGIDCVDVTFQWVGPEVRP